MYATNGSFHKVSPKSRHIFHGVRHYLSFLLLFQRFPSFHDHLVQFVHALVQTLPDDGTGRLDVIRGGRTQFVKSQMLLDLVDRQGFGEVLLVGDDQQRRPLVLCEFRHLVKFGLGFLQPVHVDRVHHVNDAVRAAAVGLPQGPQLLLASDVPEMTADPFGRPVAELDLLGVEADGGDGVDEFVELQAVEHGGLTSRIQAEHDDVQGLERGNVGEAVPHLTTTIQERSRNHMAASPVPQSVEGSGMPMQLLFR